MKRILVTGFEPFGNLDKNASWEVVNRLPSKIGDFEVIALQLPVTFGAAGKIAIKSASNMQPDVILCIGQAAGRSAITPEYVAINLRHATIPDNIGYQPYEEPIVEDGPAAYFSSLPVFRIAEAISASAAPAAVSYSAGTFVCNDLFYLLLHHFHETGIDIGFIHIPLLAEQATDGQPSVNRDEAIRAIITAITELQ